MNPCDAIAKALEDEPAIEEQDSEPSSDDLEELEKLAMDAARLQDELKEIQGDRPTRLRNLKKQVLEKMLKHGLRELKLPDRPAIEVVTRNNRKPTKKAITGVLGKAEADKLWSSIEPTTSNSLEIPDPVPPEVESPY